MGTALSRMSATPVLLPTAPLSESPPTPPRSWPALLLPTPSTPQLLPTLSTLPQLLLTPSTLPPSSPTLSTLPPLLPTPDTDSSLDTVSPDTLLVKCLEKTYLLSYLLNRVDMK